MKDQNDPRLPWQPLFSELVGTALLVLIGLSLDILMAMSESLSDYC